MVVQTARIGAETVEITLLLNLTGGEVKQQRPIASKSLVYQGLRAARPRIYAFGRLIVPEFAIPRASPRLLSELGVSADVGDDNDPWLPGLASVRRSTSWI